MTRQIIVCDDEPHIIRAISLKFTRAGFDVKGATDVDSCWRMLIRNQAPDFLIVDDSLSQGVDGLELVRRVRSDSRLADLPIILMTSQDAELDEYKEQLSDYGIARVIAKPFSPRELLSTVCCFLGSEDPIQAPSFVHHRNLTSIHLVPCLGYGTPSSTLRVD